MISKLFGGLFPKRDPATLYISIDELPNPRDWGTLDFAVGGKLIFRVDVNLLAGSADTVLDLMALHWQTIQCSGYQRITYHNVSSWLQERIEQKLYRGWTADRTLSLQIPVGSGVSA